MAERQGLDDPMDPVQGNVWVEVSAGAHAANLRFFRRLIGPDVELAAVVKANAYGHGLETVAALGCIILVSTTFLVWLGFKLVGRDFMMRDR